jgi:hypothetical protein
VMSCAADDRCVIGIGAVASGREAGCIGGSEARLLALGLCDWRFVAGPDDMEDQER